MTVTPIRGTMRGQRRCSVLPRDTGKDWFPMLDESTTKPPRDRRASSAAYRAAHREEINARNAVWYEAHREEINARRAPRDRKAYHAVWYAAHRAENTAKCAVYYAAHRAERRAYNAAYQHARNARLAGLPSERVLLSVLFERDKGICGICQKRVYKNARDKMMRPSHDHILPVSHGGANTYANARLAHRRCNTARGNRGAAQLRMTA